MSCNSNNCNCCQKTPCGCTHITETNCVKYTGVDLTCLGVTSGDKLEDVLSKIEEAICYTQNLDLPSSSVVSLLTIENVNNWNESYSWGDHSEVGYFSNVTLTNPVDGDTLVYDGTTEEWKNQPLGGGGLETDPIFLASTAAGIGSGDVINWDTAYSWGDHALVGYLTSFIETDPIFTAHPAFNVINTGAGTLFLADDGTYQPAGGSGSTNLAYTPSPTDGTVTSDTGTDATLTLVDGVNAGLMSPSDKTKLDGIEPLADVTDATNVDAAGAVMNTDTSTSAMSFVVDEDNMVSNSDTLIPTQQSVKAYVDNLVVTGSTLKEAVDLATAIADGNITLSGEQTIDGVLTSNSRVLVKNQTLDAENGIYITSTGAWTRATDYDNSPVGEIKEGNLIYVLEGGTENQFTGWRQISPDVVTIDTDPITFNQFQGLPTLSHTQNTDTGTTSSTWDINTTGNTAQIQTGLLTGNQAYDLPDATGTIALTSDILTTNLAVANKTATTLDVTSSDGTDATIPSATITEAGLMSSTDKTKLDGVASGANNYTHPNHTGEVTSTGDGATVVDSTAITNKTTVTPVAGDFVLISDTSDSGNLKKVDASDFLAAGADGNGMYDGAGTIPTATVATVTDSLTFSDGQVVIAPATAITPTGGAITTIDWNTSNNQTIDLSSATSDISIDLSTSNPQPGAVYTLKFIQHPTTPVSIVTVPTSGWDSDILWESGNKLALSSGSAAIDLVTMYYDGVNYLASYGANYS